MSYLNVLFYFDVIAALAIAITVIVFSYLYFKDTSDHFVREGVTLTIVWLLITLILDVVLIYLGVSDVSLIGYAITVVPLYIIIPAITIGFGLYKNQMTQ